MSELFFLGTGGSVATLERDNTSFLVNSGRSLILVDCPGSVIQKVRKTGSNPSEVSSILVTHIHPDHIYGLPSFVHSLMFVDSVIRIYGSEESVGFSQKLLDMFHLLDKDKKIRVDFIPLNPNQKIKLDDSLEIFTFPVPHSSASLAFKFTFVESGKQLLYSSDTPIYSSLFEKAEGIDYLIHDCSAPSRFFRKYPSLRTMHSDSLELGQQAQQAKVKCLIPCHFFGELDFNITEIEEEIKKNYQGKLIIPSDLDRISL